MPHDLSLSPAAARTLRYFGQHPWSLASGAEAVAAEAGDTAVIAILIHRGLLEEDENGNLCTTGIGSGLLRMAGGN